MNREELRALLAATVLALKQTKRVLISGATNSTFRDGMTVVEHGWAKQIVAEYTGMEDDEED